MTEETAPSTAAPTTTTSATVERDATALYEKLESLGRGQIADVYRGKLKETGEEIAIKVVDLGEALDENDELAPILEEIDTLSHVNCPYLTHYRAAHVVNQGAEIWIITEFCAAGSVADIMKTRHGKQELGTGICAKGGLDEPEIAFILQSVLRGLDYLHSRDVPHSGVKCSNVLISANGEVKLTDYGVFEQLQHQMTKRDTFMHSPYWLAPEIISQGEAAPFSTRSDIWGVGITALEMAIGHAPRFEEHPIKAIFNIPKCDPPELPETISSKFSDKFKDFVRQCLQKDPDLRPTVQQLLQHPFILTKIDGPSVLLSDISASIKARSPIPSTSTSAQKQTQVNPGAAGALSGVIYPTLSKLLQEGKGKDNEQTVMALARIKMAFDNLERTKQGSVHHFVSFCIEALSAHNKK